MPTDSDASSELSPTEMLVRDAAAGNPMAQSQLFHRFAHRLLALIEVKMSSALRRRYDPEDVLQEVSLEAHRLLPGFEPRGPGSYYAWLASIAVNKILNLAQKTAAQRRAPARERRIRGGASSGATGAAWEPAANETSPSVRVDRGDAVRRVVDASRGLSPRESAVFELRYLRGVPPAEVARRLDLTSDQVYVALSRAVRKLHDRLETKGEG